MTSTVTGAAISLRMHFYISNAGGHRCVLRTVAFLRMRPFTFKFPHSLHQNCAKYGTIGRKQA